MSALEMWHQELYDGQRTTLTFDVLWESACQEAADNEFAAYIAPQREYLAKLTARDVIASDDRLADRFPALDEWRRLILEDPNERTPLERAAAWEATAADYEEAGDYELAEEAFANAESVILAWQPQ